MRVLMDLRWMRPGLAGGIENLSRSLLTHLLALDGFNRYDVLVPAEIKYDFDLRSRSNFRISVHDGPADYSRRLLWRGWRALVGDRSTDQESGHVAALRRLRGLDVDVALSIPGYIHPDLFPFSNVLFVPDIQHEYHPEFFSPGALIERRRIYTESIRRAEHLCAISEFTRQTLIERLEVPPARVTTVRLAADPIYHLESPYRGRSSRVLQRYGLRSGEYLFYPAHTWPHKNHRVAFRALRLLRDGYGLDPWFVCTGSPKEAQGELVSLIDELKLRDRVRFLGYCPETEMPGLYEGAAALVFPSFFEGFGLPLLEAMWCDCPVVCSRATSLPEIAGEAALLADPRSPEELAHAVSRVLTEEELRARLVARGRDQVRKFSWVSVVASVVRILYEVRAGCYGVASQGV
jgi:glycosyltransferase involved in cell wall biosynthesis